ncbi:MAG TPA: YggU family protein [Epsilonproteobacteria bacterium]|nr:YggU family protein [Campylobacterota bacterium]
MFYEIKNNEVSLRLKAQPAASKNEFCEVYGDEAIKIRIKAPAVEGAANKELVKFLAKTFKVAKSDVVFKTGQNSKIKIVTFPLTEQFDRWKETYKQET